MNFIEQTIPGVWVIEPKVFTDPRGYFMESFKQSEFHRQVSETTFIQDNESNSCFGVLRGLHFQKGEYAQAKLVRVIQGAVFDVAVDMRKGSPTFGQYVGVELSADNKKQLFIPRGFAHGFLVLSSNAIFSYKVDNIYNANSEGSVRYDDPDIAISWPVATSSLLLSAKDEAAPYLKDAYTFLK